MKNKINSESTRVYKQGENFTISVNLITNISKFNEDITVLFTNKNRSFRVVI